MAFSTPANPDSSPAGWQDRALDRTLADARARDVERMERCVAAARELASETTSTAFTVAQIAQRAGLSLKSFYRCFPGKDELLLALLEDDSQIGARALAERVEKALAERVEKALAERVETALEQRVSIRDNPVAGLHACVTELFALVSQSGQLGYASVLVREHRRLSEHYPLELRVALAPLVELLAVHIAAATGTSDARRDAETMFRVILQGIDDVVVGRVGDATEQAEYLWRFCWHGLAGPRTEGTHGRQ
jgi:AcrR family transcriptional regulator